MRSLGAVLRQFPSWRRPSSAPSSPEAMRANRCGPSRLSEAYLLAGREADARAAAQRALGLARQHKERGHEAYTLRLLGEIAAREDPPDVGEAEDHYRQALALAEELGMRPLIAHCHVGLGKLYRRSGNLQQAKKHLTNGVAMMREMEMGLWLEKAEAELKELH